MPSHVPASRATAAIGAALLVLLAGVVPASAAAPSQVHIVSHMRFIPNQFNEGDFVATGDAVDDGSMCAEGTVVDTRIIFAGGQSDRGLQIPVRKTFTCADGSGSIFVKIQVHLDFATNTETFSWVVLGGTDRYERLQGSGLGTTASDGSDPQTGNYNTYDGFVID
jgi:hypothetical protein